MYIGLFDIWKRILQSLGLIPPVNSRYILKEQRTYQNRVKPPEFDSAKQVRVLLFRELNGQERRLLFDSKAVRKRDPTASPGGKPPLGGRRNAQESSIEKSFKLSDNQSRDYVYEWQKSSSDETLLREMIFGSVSISYQGTTLKVHTIRSPSQIMLSLVFPAPPAPLVSRAGERETEESGTWTSSVEVNIDKTSEKSDTHLAHSVPVDVPSRLSGQYNECRDSDSDSLQSHDGHSSLPTTHLAPEVPTGGLPRSSSYNSLQRRIMRNKATSIEFGLPKAEDGSHDYSRSRGGPKRSKLGLSIVINLSEDENKLDNKHFTDFLFTHISLIEGHLMSLKDTVIRAYSNRKNFVHLMFEGSKKFQQSLNDLYTAPRLQNPEWLTIISSPNHRHLSYAFLERFYDLLKLYDKKETNFFVSTLLTAVLTHHLAWVPSVIPTDSKIQSTQSSHKHTPYWVDLLAKSRPYNPLWVQLSDLYGALGAPLKLTKTIVKGQRKEIVLNFLKVLSYFIRCSDICHQVHERADDSIADNERLQGNHCEDSTEVTISTESSCSTPVVHSPNSNPSLPRNFCLPQLTTASVDRASSDSSKDNCDLAVTPTAAGKRTCDSLVGGNSPSINKTKSQLVPIYTNEAAKSSGLDSLGYMSLEEKVETVCGVSKRPALREQPPNRCHDATSGSGCLKASGIGKENEPVVRTMDGKKQCCCQSGGCKVAKLCCDGGCLCYDDQIGETKDYCSSKAKECESIEEGYHSMEEPHSPSREKVHLGEMLKRLENWHPEGCEEVLIPGLRHLGESIDPSPYKSFGWSLMAGVSDHYLMDFCLQGVSGPLDEEEIREDLIRSTHIHVLGEPVSESICLVADTDKWNVHLLSSHCVGGDKLDSMGTTVVMSSLVSGICDAIMNMVELRIPPESCIIYLEDRLQELYTRSQTLADFVRGSKAPVPQSKIANTLNVDISDLPLLLSVATTHSPNLSVYSR